MKNDKIARKLLNCQTEREVRVLMVELVEGNPELIMSYNKIIDNWKSWRADLSYYAVPASTLWGPPQASGSSSNVMFRQEQENPNSGLPTYGHATQDFTSFNFTTKRNNAKQNYNQKHKDMLHF